MIFGLTDDAVARITNGLGKLGALHPSNKKTFKTLASDTVNIQKVSQEFNPEKLIEALQKDENDTKKLNLTGTLREHQKEILASEHELIKKFKSGNGTFLDLNKYFYQFVLGMINLDV